ncbi:MAG: 3-hydroxyacyl-CoA dehydrogenase NAD-binding domain-containing protein [candidate division Zixibacteria bacterium]|nr:3-hydroxyacyl-CoA dehydrogenase NAD-binding domain-containing protein [candidate division Zixibacteria bacterium]
MEIKKVGVVGCGLMGSGIVETAAKAGFPVVVREVSDELLKKGRSRIEVSLSRAVEKQKATPQDKEAALGRITGTTRLADLADCDLVIEAVIENMEEKKKLFKELDATAKPSALFASNTSSLPITDMAAVTKRAPNFVGLHFFNPVPVMKLVEVVKTVMTSEEAFRNVKAFAEKLGKTVVVAKDTPGFVVNLLLVPYLLDAVRAYENGVASREDIDNGMVLGCGHPMGPLTLLDFVGIDTTYYIAEIMFDEFKDDHYAAPPLMRRLVAAGFWGRKTGRGIYEYDEKGNKK